MPIGLTRRRTSLSESHRKERRRRGNVGAKGRGDALRRGRREMAAKGREVAATRAGLRAAIEHALAGGRVEIDGFDDLRSAASLVLAAGDAR